MTFDLLSESIKSKKFQEFFYCTTEYQSVFLVYILDDRFEWHFNSCLTEMLLLHATIESPYIFRSHKEFPFYFSTEIICDEISESRKTLLYLQKKNILIERRRSCYKLRLKKHVLKSLLKIISHSLDKTFKQISGQWTCLAQKKHSFSL